MNFLDRSGNWLEELRRERTTITAVKKKSRVLTEDEKLLNFVLSNMSKEQMEGYLKGLKLIYKVKEDQKNKNHPEHWRWEGKGKNPQYRDPSSYCGHLSCPVCKKENLESDVFLVLGLVGVDQQVHCTNGHYFRTSEGQ